MNLSRKTNRFLAFLLSICMILSVMPLFEIASAVADALTISREGSLDHATHAGCKRLTMGESYVAIDGVEQSNNCLPDGSYCLDGDITVALAFECDGAVLLCLNGHSIAVTEYSAVDFWSKTGASLTIDDCVGTGGINCAGSSALIAEGASTVTIDGGTIGGSDNTYGIKIYSGSTKLFVNGGSVIGSKYGIDMCSNKNEVYLSGAPVISGGTADMNGGIVYADNGAANPVPYSGQEIELYRERSENYCHGDILVAHLTDVNKGLFKLSESFLDKFTLVYDDALAVLRLEGEEMDIVWYDEDETTVLSGPNYPSKVHYGERVHPVPIYEKEGYYFLGWQYRNAGYDWWRSDYYGEYESEHEPDYDPYILDAPTEFKAVFVSSTIFSGDGTAESPFLIQNADDLLKLADLVKQDYSCYNSKTVHYQLAADIDLSSVCGENKGNWDPIGKNNPFCAQFDGNGHTISDLYYSGRNSRIGLFSCIVTDAAVRNLTVTGFVSAEHYFNGIVGENYGGTIENCLDLTVKLPFGYTSDENGKMAYALVEANAVDVKAIYDNNWIDTSFNDEYTLKSYGIYGLVDAEITMTPSIINDGAYVKVLYTVTNNGTAAITGGKLAVHSDIQIGDNDDAAIEVIQDSRGKAIGFKMVDNHTVDENPNCISREAQLNLYFAGAGGVTDADTYWFGRYSDREENAFHLISDTTASKNKEYEKDENGNYIKLNNTDSGIAFSWQNIDLAPGESKEFSWVINIGFKADPPQWKNDGVNLSVTTDAVQNNMDIKVAAKVKDAAGVTDKLYYSVGEGEGVLLGGVIADGETEKTISGVIHASEWANGTYNLDFWVVNGRGAVSEKLRRIITITDGMITGDVAVLNPELSHDWNTDWSYDEAYHWHDCKNTNCTISVNADKYGFSAHSFDSSCDATCDICGYTRTITHTFNQKVMTEQYCASAGSCIKKAEYYYSCVCGEKGATTFPGDFGAHAYAYSASGAIIDETCTGGCGHTASATLVAPRNCTYDGAAKTAAVSYSADWKGGTMTVTYGTNDLINVGTVQAVITKDNQTAELWYKITAATAVVTAPTAKNNLVYDGREKELVNAGSTTGGTMQYAIGTSADTAPASGWSTDIPQGSSAGTYYVWYKVDGGINYHNADPVCITAAIAKAEITITADNKTKTYGDTDPAFTWSVTAGSVKANDTLAGIKISAADEKNVGKYSITVTQSEGSNPNYNITFANGTLTIVPKEIGIRWSNTSLIYNGSAQKPTATATGTVNGDWITLVVGGAQTNASGTAYTAFVTGIEGTMADNYKLPTEKTTQFTIAKADQAAPAGVGKTDESISKKGDGVITGIDATMEYRRDGEDAYTDINSDKVENLAAGSYYVRVKGDSNHNPSAETSVTIASGRKLKITLPAQQIGYTLTSTVYEVDYLGSATLTFTLKTGYSMADDFAISLSGNRDMILQNGQLHIKNIDKDIDVAVSGVADMTAPTAQIELKENKWNSFLNTITFGLFFKETQNVTVTADDHGSGVDKIQYYVSGEELTRDELDSISGWKDYNEAFKLNPDNRYVVYVKAVDRAGNTCYISSDGLVFDSIAPAFYGIENGGVYYGDMVIRVSDQEHYPVSLAIDGVDVTDKISNDEYTVTADNKEHTLVATDKAGNVTECKIAVYKNYTVTYKIDGEIVSTEIVGYGKDAALPAIPEKEGYDRIAPKWDKDGKVISGDTVINAVYTINEYTITFMAGNDVYKTLTYKHGETVTMPAVPAKNGYTVTWETTIDKATADVTVKAVYTELPATEKPGSPQTGDAANPGLYIALQFVSVIAITVLTVYDRKRRTKKN